MTRLDVGHSKRRRRVVAFLAAVVLGAILSRIVTTDLQVVIFGGIAGMLLVLVMVPWIETGEFLWTLWRRRPR